MIDKNMFVQKDIRGYQLYKEVEDFYGTIFNPGNDFICDLAHVSASPCGKYAGFTGTIYNDMASAPLTRVVLANLENKVLSQVVGGDYSDLYPRWSPDGETLAFLSDRDERGINQLYLTSPKATKEAQRACTIEGVIEHYSWSPNGKYILLSVAGLGADMAGCQGGATTASRADDLPDWLPTIEVHDSANLWRWLCIYEVSSGEVRQLNLQGINVWEAHWSGNEHVVAVASNYHSEGSWYQSTLIEINIASEQSTTLHTPQDQIAFPRTDSSNRYAACIEALCSDRVIVSGDLVLIDKESNTSVKLDTQEVSVTGIHWNGTKLHFTGHRGLETALGYVDVATQTTSIEWTSEDITIDNWFPSFWVLPNDQYVVPMQAYNIAPQLSIVSGSEINIIHSCATDKALEDNFVHSTIEKVEWKGRDGLNIQGLLVKPEGEGPFPLVVDIHGGPIWAFRNRWMGNLRGCKLLADKGFAVLYPNPRGSSGRGQAFASHVKGDMGGEDTYDYLNGIDYLVDAGIADPDKVGVTGISYGGFMSAWLITQDTRFAAAVPISPVINWYSQHFTSQIAYFDEVMLSSSAYETDNKHFHRSPVMHAKKVKTPTLQLTGSLDQNTPPTQALEFHKALGETGVESVCVFYPKAGHGIRNFPDVIDHTARKVGWFLQHMAPSNYGE